MRKILLFFAVLSTLVLVSGCSASSDSPAVTLTSTVTTSHEPFPSPTTDMGPGEPIISHDPRNATDNPLVNATINQLLDRDIVALTDKIQLLDVPCTLAEGLGGPPKCPPGFANGTVMTVFPVSCGEGSYIGPEPERVAVAIIDYPEPQLYSVILLEPREIIEWYFPMGVYSVVLDFDTVELGRTFRLDDQGMIVLVKSCVFSLEQEVTATEGTILFSK